MTGGSVPWVLLDLRLLPDGSVATSYVDSRGRRTRVPDFNAEDLPIEPLIVDVGYHHYWPVRLPVSAEMVADLAQLVVHRVGPHVYGPAPVAVYVKPPAELLGLRWERVANYLTPHVEVEPVRLVRRRGWTARRPFRLPLVLRAIDEATIEPLRHASWLELGDTQSFGIVVETISEDRPSFEQLFGADIVVVPADRSAATFRAARRAGEDGPRLVVVTGGDAITAAMLRPPPSVSAIWLEEQGAPNALDQLVLAIAHDLSLPEAVHEVRRTGGAVDAVLVSDPIAAQQLRMAQAFGAFTRASAALQSSARVGDFERFLERVPLAAVEVLEPRLRELSSIEATLRAVLAPLQLLKVDFGRESWGLRPLAEAERSLAEAEQVQIDLELRLADLAHEPEPLQELARHQQRRADFSLRRDAMPPLVEPGEALQPGERYHLLVQIGTPLPLSLLKEPPPPLDPLLPDAEPGQGHELEIVVFPQQFVLHSAAVHTVHLPDLGGTSPVEFELEAPDWDGLQQASARVAIYHDNHLVQSFRFASSISVEPKWVGEQGARVELEFSRTNRFRNLDDLKPRALSLGLNADEFGNHRLLLKAQGAAENLLLDAALLDSAAKRFRDELTKATFVGGDQPRFPISAAGGAPSEECLAVLRELARQGGALHRELFGRSGDSFQDRLREFMCTRDQTVQIIRLDPNYAFPWSAVYDFLPPRGRVGTRLRGHRSRRRGVRTRSPRSGLVCKRFLGGSSRGRAIPQAFGCDQGAAVETYRRAEGTASGAARPRCAGREHEAAPTAARQAKHRLRRRAEGRNGSV